MPMPEPTSTIQVPLLTERQREVLVLLARGASSREIADELELSHKTIETHVEHIQDKIGVKSRVKMARWAIRNGLASVSETDDWQS